MFQQQYAFIYECLKYAITENQKSDGELSRVTSHYYSLGLAIGGSLKFKKERIKVLHSEQWLVPPYISVCYVYLYSKYTKQTKYLALAK